MAPIFRALVALLLVTSCDQAPRAARAAEMNAARGSAIALVEEWAAAGSEGRWDDLVMLYADEPEFTWVEQGEIRYADRAAIEAGVAQVRAAQLQVHTVISDVVATPLSPDAATVRANYAIVFGDPAEGGYSFEGILTGVAVQRGGRWQFLQGHLSSPPQRAANAPQ